MFTGKLGVHGGIASTSSSGLHFGNSIRNSNNEENCRLSLIPQFFLRLALSMETFNQKI